MTCNLTANVPSFLSYLQKRMDFIAQVATSAPSWCLVTSCDDLIDHFNEQYCLISHIIRSHQGVKTGQDFEPLFDKEYDPTDESAPDLDIPHGEIGGQAFYTILENIIRNTAKYGDTQQLEQIKAGDGKLRFKIIVRDRQDEKGPGWLKDFYQVQIEDQLRTRQGSPNTKEDVVANLNNFLSEPLTNPATGVVMPKYWGMKEIKICAAYLRMVKQDQIDLKFAQWDKEHDGQPPPIIKVSLENLKKQDNQVTGNLTYTLYMLRPKKALVVMPSPAATVRENFRRAGVDFYSLEEFKQQIDAGESPRHWFLVLPKPTDASEWQWLSKNLNFLPPRVILLNCKEEDIPQGTHARGQLKRSLAFMDSLPVKNPAELLDKLWANWVGRWWSDFEIFVRWSLHHDTIAERGENQEWDDVAEEARGRWLVFDHHPRADTTRLFELAAFHEVISWGLPTLEMLQKRSRTLIKGSEPITSKMLERQSRLRIKEAAALSVAVIDERVWLEKDGEATQSVKYYIAKEARSRRTVWAKRRVFLQDTNSVLRNFDEFVDSLTPPDRGVFDFVIIHQGIIDSVKEKSGSDFKSAWKTLKSKTRWLVVDSGRGQPEEARVENLRWVEYSNLAECLIQYAGDKLKLAELLWTLRASSRSGGDR